MAAKANPGQLPDGAGRAVGADNIVISSGTGPAGIVEQRDVIAPFLPPPGDQLMSAFHQLTGLGQRRFKDLLRPRLRDTDMEGIAGGEMAVINMQKLAVFIPGVN